MPDIDDALLNPKEHFDGQYFLPEAAFNLELRMALYESVFLHLLVSNGTSVICSYNKNARFIQFIGEGYLDDKVRLKMIVKFHLVQITLFIMIFRNLPGVSIPLRIFWKSFIY